MRITPPNALAPLVIGTVTALSGARDAVEALSRSQLPDDPALRALLRRGVDDGLRALRTLAAALLAFRRRLDRTPSLDLPRADLPRADRPPRA